MRIRCVFWCGEGEGCVRGLLGEMFFFLGQLVLWFLSGHTLFCTEHSAHAREVKFCLLFAAQGRSIRWGNLVKYDFSNNFSICT